MADGSHHQPSSLRLDAMFVRFVAGSDAENAFWLTGVITTARILLDDGTLNRHEAGLLKEVFEWFNHHLPCPPLSREASNRRMDQGRRLLVSRGCRGSHGTDPGDRLS